MIAICSLFEEMEPMKYQRAALVLRMPRDPKLKYTDVGGPSTPTSTEDPTGTWATRTLKKKLDIRKQVDAANKDIEVKIHPAKPFRMEPDSLPNIKFNIGDKLRKTMQES